MTWEEDLKAAAKRKGRRANWWLLGVAVGVAMQIGRQPADMNPVYAIGVLVAMFAYGRVCAWEVRAKSSRAILRDVRSGALKVTVTEPDR